VNRVVKKKVVLIGFPGAGKTTVGRILQKEYSWSWVDVDEAVEVETGFSISNLIREEGEEYFRSLERKVVKNAVAGSVDVISLGGGALLNEETRREVEDTCLLVHLKVSAERSSERVIKDERDSIQRGEGMKRPLLASEEVLMSAAVEEEVRQNVSELMDSRRGLYELAHHTLDTDGLTARQLAAKIVELVEEQSDN